MSAPLELIDTHVHLLHADRFTYAWCAGQACLAGNHTLSDYRHAAARAGSDEARVTSLLFMEGDLPPSQGADETEFFGGVAEHDDGAPKLAALIAGVKPEEADFPVRLGALCRNPAVRGLRRVLHTQPDTYLQSSVLVTTLRRLAETGLVFELCARPRQLRMINTLVAACTETMFVLDHAGAPDVAAGDLNAWREGLRELAARPNVVCKFSGLGSLADPAQPLTGQVRPVFAECLEAFGVERLLWGSDWPVSPDLVAWVRATTELLRELSPAERVAIATKNAQRVYRLR